MIEKTLDWLRANELPTGGIASWPGNVAYPECTGYLIPTLFDWGEYDFAVRCADWLLSIQQPCGGYHGMDDLLYTFDTAAIVEGLERAAKETGAETYLNAATKARAWISGQRTAGGGYIVREGLGAPQHNYRVNGIMRDNPGVYHIVGNGRVHFLAYALEGYLMLGYRDEVRGTLEAMPYRADHLSFFGLDNWQGGGSDIIATAQLAILMLKTGMDASAQIEAVRRNIHADGGVPQSLDVQTCMSWGAKFYLDMEALVK